MFALPPPPRARANDSAARGKAVRDDEPFVGQHEWVVGRRVQLMPTVVNLVQEVTARPCGPAVHSGERGRRPAPGRNTEAAIDDRHLFEQRTDLARARPLSPQRAWQRGSRRGSSCAIPVAPQATSRRRRRPLERFRPARTRPSAAMAVMNCVPLIRERPSFGARRWERAPPWPARRRKGVGRRTTPRLHRRVAPGVRAARGRRSRRRSHATARAAGHRVRDVEQHPPSERAPENPFASAFARSSIAARVTSAGYGLPTLHAWPAAGAAGARRPGQSGSTWRRSARTPCSRSCARLAVPRQARAPASVARRRGRTTEPPAVYGHVPDVVQREVVGGGGAPARSRA